MSKVHEIVKKGKQMEPVYLGEIVVRQCDCFLLQRKRCERF